MAEPVTASLYGEGARKSYQVAWQVLALVPRAKPETVVLQETWQTGSQAGGRRRSVPIEEFRASFHRVEHLQTFVPVQ